jgi:hypothetical protein
MAAEAPERWVIANVLSACAAAYSTTFAGRMSAGDDTRRIAGGWNNRDLTRVIFIGASDLASNRTLTVGGNTTVKQRRSIPAAFG